MSRARSSSPASSTRTERSVRGLTFEETTTVSIPSVQEDVVHERGVGPGADEDLSFGHSYLTMMVPMFRRRSISLNDATSLLTTALRSAAAATT